MNFRTRGFQPAAGHASFSYTKYFRPIPPSGGDSGGSLLDKIKFIHNFFKQRECIFLAFFLLPFFVRFLVFYFIILCLLEVLCSSLNFLERFASILRVSGGKGEGPWGGVGALEELAWRLDKYGRIVWLGQHSNRKANDVPEIYKEIKLGNRGYCLDHETPGL